MKLKIGFITVFAMALFMGESEAREMKYQKTNEPLVVVIALNEGSEITDFFVPLAMLGDITKVVSVSVNEGLVSFWPGLNARMEYSISSFKAEYPDGADIVIVPAVHDAEDKKLGTWLNHQAQQGALVVSICDGAFVLANAGLLKNKKATAHFYSLDKLEKQFPATTWVRDVRFVHDDNVISTTGVSASFPASLYLVELISGASAAEELAEKYHVKSDIRKHTTAQFNVGFGEYQVAILNMIKGLFSNRYFFDLEEGMDEVGLAIYLDAFSRTYRSKVLTVSDMPITTAHGVLLVPDLKQNSKKSRTIRAEEDDQFVVDEVLLKIAHRFGTETADLVALQLEYDLIR